MHSSRTESVQGPRMQNKVPGNINGGGKHQVITSSETPVELHSTHVCVAQHRHYGGATALWNEQGGKTVSYVTMPRGAASLEEDYSHVHGSSLQVIIDEEPLFGCHKPVLSTAYSRVTPSRSRS